MITVPLVVGTTWKSSEIKVPLNANGFFLRVENKEPKIHVFYALFTTHMHNMFNT